MTTPINSAISLKTNGLHRTYSVTHVYISVADNETTTSTVKQKVIVKALSPQENGSYLFELSRSPVDVDGIPAEDLPAANLAQQCAQVLDPLQVTISRARLICGYANYKDIFQRWKIAEPQLRQYFTDELAADYISQCSGSLMTAEAFYGTMQQDILLKALFPPVYNYYPAGRSAPVIIAYPLQEDGEMCSLNINQTVVSNDDAGAPLHTVHQEGTLVERMDGINTITLDSIYSLSKETGQIEDFEICWVIETNSGTRNVTISATTIPNESIN